MRANGLKMLVADDNPVLVGALYEIFNECGHNVRVASNGFVALAEIKNEVPDVLPSDLSMPGMSGYELLSVVRRRFPAIRVIAMSGAHSGDGVPPGVAADAFYAKGERSVAQLIQMVRAVWFDEAHLLRSSTPVWISQISIEHAGSHVLFACCPECLRPFPHHLTSIGIQRREETCPHCLMAIDIAFVREPIRIDGTPIAISPARLDVDHSTCRARRSDGAPTGRTHQQ